MSLRRYPTYKDSGVEWLGEVPGHWDIDRFKWSTVSCKNGIWGDEAQQSDDDIPCVRVADFDRQKLRVDVDAPTLRCVSSKERTGRVLSQGDLLLEKSGGGELHPVGCVVMYDDSREAVCSNFIARMELAPAMSPSFWRYAHAAAYAVRLNTKSIKQTSGIQNLDQQAYLDELCAFPPLTEQAHIAAFLDRETAKLDALVAEQQRLIELLKEKRQAIISHAVTKGLNPDAPMKDSGVEWLGEVPAHWERTQIKYCLTNLIDTEHKTTPFHEDGEYLVVRTSNIKDGKLLLDGAKYTDVRGFEEWTRRGTPQPGDILFTREAPAGEACLVPSGVKLCMGQRIVLMQLDRVRLDPLFGLLSLSSGLAIEFVAELSQGSTVTHFNMSDIKNIPMMLPPLREQNEIALFLEGQSAKFDTLTTEAQRAIDLLQERRAALISAAVTGQINVQPTTERRLQ